MIVDVNVDVHMHMKVDMNDIVIAYSHNFGYKSGILDATSEKSLKQTRWPIARKGAAIRDHAFMGR